jgi:hypothetical protein
MNFPASAKFRDHVGGAVRDREARFLFFVGVARDPVPQEIVRPPQPMSQSGQNAERDIGFLRRNMRKSARGKTARRESTLVVASAERACPSKSDISPKNSPLPISARVVS